MHRKPIIYVRRPNCVEINADFGVFVRESATLTRFGVVARYPNELQLEEHDAERAIRYADKIMEFVKGLLDTSTGKNK